MSEYPQFNCENEPIHIPGRIQDNGFLLGVDPDNLSILYASENLGKYASFSATGLINSSLHDFLVMFSNGSAALKVEAFLSSADLANYQAKNCVSIKDVHGNNFILVAHRYNDIIIAEFEIQTQDDHQDKFDFSETYSSIVSFNTVKERCEYLCERIRLFSGYDRVMIYQFDENYNGEVIAENNVPGVHSFLHHRFPSTDIPQQARELYVKNLMRIISDVNDEGSSLVASPSTGGQPLDMSYSILRAVSPVHIAYLKNMGVQASFSTSIIVQGKLWGLVTCHNFKPSLISYNNRFNCRTLTQILGNSIFILNSLEINLQKEKFSRSFGDVVKSLALHSNPKNVLNHKLNDATGAAYIKGNEVELVGKTPSRSEVLNIADHVFSVSPVEVFATNMMGNKMTLSQEAIDMASGVLAIPILAEIKEMLIWFKPEMPVQVQWAGKPEKIIAEYKGKPSLNPRTSFLSWSEKVNGMSAPWTLGEIETAKNLQSELEHITHLKAQEIKLLHEKLKMAYDELSTFSYTVSHDLKIPLTGIKNYTELIALTEENLTEDGRSYLNTVVNSADKMNALINEIFNYTRAGLIDINATEVDMHPIIERIIEENTAVYKDKVNVQVGELNCISGDAMMLYQLFGNLLSNAIKYASKTEGPKVTIDSYKQNDKIHYIIQDNGIGIPPQEVNRLFLPFVRMSNSKEFDGTGLGMAIVKRVTEKHRAEIAITSELNKGTTCTIIFRDKL